MGVRSSLHKLRWGASQVGVPATLRGMIRYGVVRIRRPPNVIVVLRSGGSLELRLPGQLVPALIVFGDLIDPEYALLRRLPPKARTVVDVGAAIGQFAVAAALTGADVHACEPSPANLATLRANIARNGIDALVRVHPVALADTVGRAAFPTTSRTYMSRLDAAAAVTDTVDVDVLTLAAALDEWGIPHVDVLKLNVAGYEPAVLAGAEPVFAAGRIDLLIALIGAGSLAWYARLHALGYRFFFYDPRADRLHEVNRFDDEFLQWRPSPARHVLAARGSAIDAGLFGDIPIDATRAQPATRWGAG